MMDEHSRSCPEFDPLILDGCTCGLRQRRQFAEDCRLMMERMKSRSVSDVLALLADEEITLKKAQEWIGEFVLLGHRGPLTHVIPRTGYMLTVSELEALIDVYNKGEFKDADALASRFIDLTKRHQTEQSMHAAWRKRAEEAERDLAAAQQERDSYMLLSKMRPAPMADMVPAEDLAAALAERNDFKAAYLSVIQERKKAEAEAAAVREAFERECADGDRLCDALGVSRTEGGSLNVPRLVSRAATLREDAERWRFVNTHPNYQGSRNGYRTFKEAVDAARKESGNG